MSPAYEARCRDALKAVRMAAERADQARDTEAMIRELTAVSSATLKALFEAREAEEATRLEALKAHKEIAA
ncbi:hypothetical protein [Phenylobacterium sp.]|uniref:hypothetical protein n=1 Tax=Phenylobacterium sp. TaxID=1871053 RepID=UPI00260BC5C5|nr:hypothetical protein [Phenylobacterium sp.]